MSKPPDQTAHGPTEKTPGARKPTSRKPANKQQRATVEEPTMLDRRLMEKTLADVQRLLMEQDFETIEETQAFLNNLQGNQVPHPEPRTPLEEAQDIVYQALEAKGKRRVELAKKALEISPDCAEAYNLLAETSKDPRTAYDYFAQGVSAGRRALGPDAFAEDVEEGLFWGLVETRPYMRALQGLAEAAWALDKRDEAISHAQELLQLNPNDNQGIRYMLAPWLLVTRDADALALLLASYPDDDSAGWAYTRLLHTLQREGPGTRVDEALRSAMEANPFVPFYLLGLLPIPDTMPEYYGMGDQNEAVMYVMESGEAWITNEEALEWLVEALVRLAPPDMLEPPASGPRQNKRPGRPRKPKK